MRKFIFVLKTRLVSTEIQILKMRWKIFIIINLIL